MKPWRKLWRDETPRFMRLPFLTRAIAAELLKMADDSGVLCDAEDWIRTVERYLAVDPNQRRTVRAALAQLMEHGYLADWDEKIVITGWAKWQGDGQEIVIEAPIDDVDRAPAERQSSVTPASDGHQSDISLTSGEHHSDIGRAPVVHHSDIEIASSARNHWGENDKIREDKEEDKTQTPRAREASPEPVTVIYRLESQVRSVEPVATEQRTRAAWCWQAVADARTAARASGLPGIAPRPQHERQLADAWDCVARAVVADAGGEPTRERVSRAVADAHRAYLASDDSADQGHPWLFWVADPMRWIVAASKSRRGRRVPPAYATGGAQ